MSRSNILALSGGVGGAKLALGLATILDADELLVVANTADDFEHFGLNISPDLDTLMYTLAGLNDKQRGWGLADETWRTMEGLESIGADTWFRLGDRDLATHLERTQRLLGGSTLTEVTRSLCAQLGVEHRVVPMTDDRVRTMVKVCPDGCNEPGTRWLGFQEYFVREQCQPKLSKVYFEHIDQANPQADMIALLNDLALEAIVVCPSNPFVSIDPILHLPGVRDKLKESHAPVVAVSPIIAGDAVKGPTAKMMRELNMPVTAVTVARYYADILDGFVLDESDAQLRAEIEDLGMAVCCTNTMMRSLDDRIKLAREVLPFSQALANNACITDDHNDQSGIGCQL